MRIPTRIAVLASLGCSLSTLIAISLLGLLSAAAVATGWSSTAGLLPDPGGFMLPVGADIPAGTVDFPDWAQPCGPEPGALAVDPSACTGSLSPFPANYDGFSTGQCTWYVATRRRVVWHTASGELGGNAGQWLQLAHADGYQIGPAPQIGAIAVYVDSGAGHVALVVGVDAAGVHRCRGQLGVLGTTCAVCRSPGGGGGRNRRHLGAFGRLHLRANSERTGLSGHLS